MPVAELKISDSDKKVLLFLKDQMRRKDTHTLESTGLAETALALGITNAVSSFSTCIARLKHQHLIEAAKSGRVMLYAFTRDGERTIGDIIKESAVKPTEPQTPPIIDNQKRDGDKPMSKTLEEALKAGVEAGKLPNPAGPSTYTAPQGLALPKEGTYTKDITGLHELFRDRINPKPDQNELSRIKEWFEKLTANGQPAFYWVQEAIVKASTKVKAEQRTIAYIIGILKSWSKYGYGSDFNVEQKRIFDRFETRFGHELSQSSRQRLLALIDSHGIVNTVAAIFETEFAVIDISKLIVDAIEGRLSGIEPEEDLTA